MNFTEVPDITPAKLEALKARIARLGIDLRQVDEQFVKGGGKGGQKINKTANAVLLRYAPLGLTVRCQRERRRSLNRFLALRELVDEIELKISPETSEKLKEIERIRRRKARRRGPRGHGEGDEG
jgi:protein subunit release factor B